MSKETVRTHVVLPKELVESVDELVGPRGRSSFLTKAVEEKLARVRLMQTAKEAAGSLADVEIPGWETSETAAEWVRGLRRTDDEKLRHRWEG